MASSYRPRGFLPGARRPDARPEADCGALAQERGCGSEAQNAEDTIFALAAVARVSRYFYVGSKLTRCAKVTGDDKRKDARIVAFARWSGLRYFGAAWVDTYRKSQSHKPDSRKVRAQLPRTAW